MLHLRSPVSLTARLTISLAVWIFLALAITAFALSTAFRNNAEQGFQELLVAHAYNLMGAIDVENGKLVGDPRLGDPRFSSPFSGWYWTVASAKFPNQPILYSSSIDGSKLNIPTVEDAPFSDQFRRTYMVDSDRGKKLQHFEAQLFVGENDQLFQVLVAADRSETANAIQTFDRQLFLFFSIFGLGTLLVSVFVVRFGLNPLTRARRSLNDIRMGKKELLEDGYPKEIQPLATEINALMDSNRKVVERARSQVGNLAHALKTPVAVVQNELLGKSDASSKIVSEQTGLMQTQIDSYLNRARIAAQKGGISARSNVEPTLNNLLRVMRKLFKDVTFNVACDDPKLVFLGEQQDLEEVIGNLVENAAKFAKSGVNVSCNRSLGNEKSLTLIIEDDGPGMSDADISLAVKRGQRLDESVPGSGLGLSIVSEIVEEYGGELTLAKSRELGGLSVEISLPCSTQ